MIHTPKKKKKKKKKNNKNLRTTSYASLGPQRRYEYDHQSVPFQPALYPLIFVDNPGLCTPL
jgi:hypothetical protein